MRWRAVPVLTNTPPVGPQRGPGENQLTPLIEPMIDKAARQLGIDRFAIRRMNAPESASKMGADQGPVTSAFMKEALDKGAEMFKWEEKKRKSGQRVGTKVTGVGIKVTEVTSGKSEPLDPPRWLTKLQFDSMGENPEMLREFGHDVPGPKLSASARAAGPASSPGSTAEARPCRRLRHWRAIAAFQR